MENTEEIFHFLEEFSKRKTKTIPQELNEYLAYVARTGDPVYQWSLVKCLFKEKLLNVITDFYETTPGIDIPPYPNVDPFNYEIMKNSLLERLDAFTAAPFTVQRICELLTFPRKQYNRIDKFMRAIEKNILVVSTREPGPQRHPEPENGEALEPVVNGSDNNSEYNVDVEMEDMSWKENAERQISEPQPSSSDTHISVNDIEARLQAKQNTPMDTQEKTSTEYESVTPPELNVSTDDLVPEKPDEPSIPKDTSTVEAIEKSDTETAKVSSEPVETKSEVVTPEVSENQALVIPEITVDDAEMTEQKLKQAENISEEKEEITKPEQDMPPEVKVVDEAVTEQQISTDESSSDSNMKEEEPKHISEVSTSSEESSSSSDNTDGNSNSPKIDEVITDAVQEESNYADTKLQEPMKDETEIQQIDTPSEEKEMTPQPAIESDNYSISDVKSELVQPETEPPSKIEEPPSEPVKEIAPTEKKEDEEKTENLEVPMGSGDS